MDRCRVKLLCNSIKGPTEANWPVSPSPGCTRLGRHCDNAIYVYARRPFTETSIPLGGNGRRIPFQGGGDRSSREYLEGEGAWVDSREIHREDSVKIQLQLATDERRHWNNGGMRYGEYFWYIYIRGISYIWLEFLMVKVFGCDSLCFIMDILYP